MAISANDIGDQLANLAPDVSWTDGLPTLTPAEIRERVSRFTPDLRVVVQWPCFLVWKKGRLPTQPGAAHTLGRPSALLDLIKAHFGTEQRAAAEREAERTEGQVP